MRKGTLFWLVSAAGCLAAATASADGEVNVYSSRHYDTDTALYRAFEEATGIRVNRIEDSADILIERMRAEGANSPADVFITVDAGRLWRAEKEGLLQPFESEVIEERVPPHLRHPDNLWTGLATRARIIFYDREDVTDPPRTYADLADPKYAGMVCTRSSSNVYMLSLLASIIAHEGEAAAEDWARGVWNNRARDPQGGDTDQLKAIVSGECDIALANHYYFARALAGDVAGLTEGIDRIGWVFPNQETTGTHVNISGAGIAKHAPDPEAAVTFMEFLLTPEGQQLFASANHEFPVVKGVAPSQAVARLGSFRADTLDLSALGRNQASAQKIYDRVGYR